MKLHTYFWRLVFLLGLILFFAGFYFWAKSGFTITFTDAISIDRRNAANIEVKGLGLIFSGIVIMIYAFFELLFKK